MKEETLVCILCRTSFRRGCGFLLRQTTGNINECSLVENKLRKITGRLHEAPKYVLIMEYCFYSTSKL